jgi:hypothetical protein
MFSKYSSSDDDEDEDDDGDLASILFDEDDDVIGCCSYCGCQELMEAMPGAGKGSTNGTTCASIGMHTLSSSTMSICSRRRTECHPLHSPSYKTCLVTGFD